MLVLAGLLAGLLGGVVMSQLRTPAVRSSVVQTGDVLIRENSRRLSEVPNAKVTVVQFVDFECASCADTFTAMDRVFETYRDRVSFVVRYFPMEGHANGQRAARAVEAAAQQGKFAAMYTAMIRGQAEWSELQAPQDGLFRQYARQLGLDMARWEADYISDSTLERIQTDVDDGGALNVTRSPTLFVNGTKLEVISTQELAASIDQALAQR